MDLDSTVALLSSNLPVGGDPNSVKKKKSCLKKSSTEDVEEQTSPIPVEAVVDSEEDEIFFGEKSDKEVHGKNSKFTRRKTLHLGQGFPKRSLDVATLPKNPQIWTQYRNPTEESIVEETKLSIAQSDLTGEDDIENMDPQFSVTLATSSGANVTENFEKLLKEQQDDTDKEIVNVENLEISKKNIAVVVPSPRKINMEKISRSPIKNNELTPSNIKTPPRRILHARIQGDEDDADTGDDSILDVNNDQMFDDTIFTEYNDQNLSVMSNKMTKKWRKKWEKEDLRKRTFGAETIDRLVAKQESLLLIEELEKSSTTENKIHPEVVEQPQEKETELEPAHLQNTSTCSEWFNTTRDEMILFEKFGEDYDEIVNEMSHTEKLKLKQEVDQSVPKDTSEILANIQDESEAYEVNHVNYSPDIIPPTPPVPKPRTRTPVKTDPVDHKPVETISAKVLFPKLTGSGPNTPQAKSTGNYFKSTAGSLQNTPNYLKPTTASKMRMSPRKKDIYTSPGYGGQQTEQAETCPRSGFAYSPTSDFLPKNKLLKRVGNSNVDLGKVISPVGQYIRSNPGQPQVIRQIRPKATKHFDDDLAAFERDEETCSNQQPILSQSEGRVKKRQFKPLPMAAYKPSKVAFEQNVPSAKDEFKPLPKVFGMGPTVEAKIIRHLGREKVPKNTDFLNSPVTMNSPAIRGKVFKSPQSLQKSRESKSTDLDETNTMEMSIRQVVEVKKMTSNRP